MPYPIEKKLVVAIASSALFDLAESDAVSGVLWRFHPQVWELS